MNNVVRRNLLITGIFVICLGIYGFLIRKIMMHDGASRYHAMWIFIMIFVGGAEMATVFEMLGERRKILKFILAAAVMAATSSIAVYECLKPDVTRRSIVGMVEAIDRYNRAGTQKRTQLVITYGRSAMLRHLTGNLTVVNQPRLSDPDADVLSDVWQQWKYHDAFWMIRRHRSKSAALPDFVQLARYPDRHGSITLYHCNAVNAPEFTGDLGKTREVILDEEWRDLLSITPATICNGKLAERNLPFARIGNTVKFPRKWTIFVINGFWEEQCDGRAAVVSAPHHPGRSMLQMSADKPIRIFSRWLDYRSDDRFKLHIVARGGDTREGDLTVALQDAIAPGAHQPVRELLTLKLLPGRFRVYTTDFSCRTMAGGRKFNLALDLQKGAAEVLVIRLEKQ